MKAQQQLEHENCRQFYWAFLVESVWFLFWWCPLFSVDCFHKLCLSGIPSEKSQVDWDLGNRMARGYWFDAKWVCPPIGSYACGIQVFCWKNEVALTSRTEYLNTSGISSHGTDSFRVKPITPTHPIPKISTYLTIFWGDTWKIEFVKTIHERRHHQNKTKQERTSSEK